MVDRIKEYNDAIQSIIEKATSFPNSTKVEIESTLGLSNEKVPYRIVIEGYVLPQRIGEWK